MTVLAAALLSVRLSAAHDTSPPSHSSSPTDEGHSHIPLPALTNNSTVPPPRAPAITQMCLIMLTAFHTKEQTPQVAPDRVLEVVDRKRS